MFRNISFLINKLLCFLACSLSVFLSAEIIRIDTLKVIEPILLELDKDSLVLFDVDSTLIIPNDEILRPGGQALMHKLILEVLNTIPMDKYPDGFLHSKVLMTAKSSLLEDRSLTLIKQLQLKQIPTIALTACRSGKLGIIKSLADWRIEDLKGLGIDFTQSFPKVNELSFPNLKVKKQNPLYKSGILFAANYPKGIVLKEFLESIAWKPAKVVFIDDRIDFLQSVEDSLKQMGIPFVGFHYFAAAKLPSALNSKVAEFQFRYMAEMGEWLSDKEAKDLMEKEQCAEKMSISAHN